MQLRAPAYQYQHQHRRDPSARQRTHARNIGVSASMPPTHQPMKTRHEHQRFRIDAGQAPANEERTTSIGVSASRPSEGRQNDRNNTDPARVGEQTYWGWILTGNREVGAAERASIHKRFGGEIRRGQPTYSSINYTHSNSTISDYRAIFRYLQLFL